MNLNELFNKLLNINLPKQFVIDCNEQKYIDNLKFQDIFDYIKSKNWHNLSPHSETLYDHLINAGRLSYEKAVELGYNEKECVKGWLTGILHDIGKPGTSVIKSKNVSFKGHGIVGSAMLDNFWSGLNFLISGTVNFVCDLEAVESNGYFFKGITVEFAVESNGYFF
jgi:putative nucleotidyltransferase with HDIG domain